MTDGVLSAVGHTPLVALRRLVRMDRFRLFAKLEALNPGGSIKDRAALNLLRGALRAGAVGPDTVVVESSSGNMGIGLAQACAVLGLRFICVVDVRTTLLLDKDATRAGILKALEELPKRCKAGDLAVVVFAGASTPIHELCS